MTRPSDRELESEAKKAILRSQGANTKAVIGHYKLIYRICERQAYYWFKRVKRKLQ